jgi:hypothetical protein
VDALKQTALTEYQNRREPAALKIMQSALSVVISLEQRKQLETDLWHINNNMGQIQAITPAHVQVQFPTQSPATTSSVPQTITVTPLSVQPAFSTIGGTGTRFLRTHDLLDQPGVSIGMSVLTLFHAPLFPLARYTAKRDGDQWRVIGKMPWSFAMYAYCVASLAIVVAIGYFAFSFMPNKNPEVVATPAPTQSLPATTDPVVNPELAKLTGELGTLDSQIAQDNNDVDKVSLDIEKERVEVESFYKRLKSDRPNEYSASEVRSHNRMVAKYRDMQNAFNDKVNSYNKKLEAIRSKVKSRDVLSDRIAELRKGS